MPNMYKYKFSDEKTRQSFLPCNMLVFIRLRQSLKLQVTTKGKFKSLKDNSISN